MAATTSEKARLLDLTTAVLELCRDGKRSYKEVCEVLQAIKDRPYFAVYLRHGEQAALFAEQKVFKVIKLGTGMRTAEDFQKAFQTPEEGCGITSAASEILGQSDFTVASREIEVDLVAVTTSDLGLISPSTRVKIYEKALERGLRLCPPEVGPQLWLRYDDQPQISYHLIGMEPINDTNGHSCVLTVAHHEGGFWLGYQHGDPDHKWDARYKWVFIRPKPE